MLVILGIIIIGLWIFYNQQVANVAREAARYAAIHSSTAPCPTASGVATRTSLRNRGPTAGPRPPTAWRR